MDGNYVRSAGSAPLITSTKVEGRNADRELMTPSSADDLWADFDCVIELGQQVRRMEKQREMSQNCMSLSTDSNQAVQTGPKNTAGTGETNDIPEQKVCQREEGNDTKSISPESPIIKEEIAENQSMYSIDDIGKTNKMDKCVTEAITDSKASKDQSHSAEESIKVTRGTTENTALCDELEQNAKTSGDEAEIHSDSVFYETDEFCSDTTNIEEVAISDSTHSGITTPQTTSENPAHHVAAGSPVNSPEKEFSPKGLSSYLKLQTMISVEDLSDFVGMESSWHRLQFTGDDNRINSAVNVPKNSYINFLSSVQGLQSPADESDSDEFSFGEREGSSRNSMPAHPECVSPRGSDLHHEIVPSAGSSSGSSPACFSPELENHCEYRTTVFWPETGPVTMPECSIPRMLGLGMDEWVRPSMSPGSFSDSLTSVSDDDQSQQSLDQTDDLSPLPVANNGRRICDSSENISGKDNNLQGLNTPTCQKDTDTNGGQARGLRKTIRRVIRNAAKSIRSAVFMCVKCKT